MRANMSNCENYKVTYAYLSPRGIMITGKCLVQAKNEIHALAVAKYLTKDKKVIEFNCKKCSN